MSDFSFEQLRSLFENLQDRLDKTAGDKLSHDELEKIRQILDRQAKDMKKASTSGSSKDTDEFIRKFWDSWRAQQPLKGISGGRPSKSSSTGDDGQTFIRRKQQELGNATGDITDSLRQSARSQREASKKRETGLNRFTKNLDKATFKLTSWTSALKSGSLAAVGTGATKKGLGALQTRIDAFRDVIASSGGQFKNMTEMTNSANQAHMSVTELADALNKSQGARMMGGASYAQLTGQLTKSTNAIGNMGLSFEQRQDAMQDYLEIQRRTGNLNHLTTNQMNDGIQSMVKSSQETAHILGLTRKEALDRQKELAADHVRNAVIRSKGLDQSQVDQGEMAMSQFGPGAQKMFEEILANGQITSKESAVYASMNKPVLDMAHNLVDKLNAHQKLDPESIAKMGQTVADGIKQSSVTGALARQTYAAGLNPEVANAIAGRAQAADAVFNTKPKEDQLADKGDLAELSAQEAMRTAASAAATAFDTLHNSLKAEFGPEMYAFMQKVINAGTSLTDFIQKLQGYPATMSALGVAAIGATAGLSAVSLAFKAFKLPGLLLNLVKGGGKAAVAEAGAAGAAGAAARGGGGTLISRWLGRAAPAAEGIAESGAGKAVLGAAAAGLKRNALIGSLFEGVGYLTGQKDFSLKNLAKSGLRIGGGALGALGGGLLTAGMGGEVVGGIGGYAAGDKLGDWLLGPDDTPATDAANAKKAQGKKANPNPAKKTADATGRQAPGVLTPEQMNQRIMEASERATNILKALKDNSDKQLELMREDLIMMRRANDRTHRLLEDGNKNTKAIMDNSV